VKLEKLLILGLIFALNSLPSIAGIKVTNLDLKLIGDQGKIFISLIGNSTEIPELKVSGQIIEVHLNKSDRFESLNRRISGANLSAFFQNDKAIIKSTLPYLVSPDLVEVNLVNNNIEITFPRNKANRAVKFDDVAPKILETKVLETVIAKTEPQIIKEDLDEKYLNKLIKENSQKEPVKNFLKQDEVSSKLSSPIKENFLQKEEPTNSFSMIGYAAKFVIFLGLVLGLFYGMVQLIKKGVLSKGKLSFLNNSKLVEVLNTTYVAPKKSLLVVKVHQQVFLISNTDSGLNFMTELQDTSGILKTTEKIVSGNNFDDNVEQANEDESLEIRLKENILESNSSIESLAETKVANFKKDVVKFSDELKRKAKRLKPIENRDN